MKPIVSIIMGSTSDLPILEKTAKMLDEMEIPFEMNALSAHRTPAEVEEFARGAEARGIKVIIAAAGMAGLVALLFYIHFEGLEAFNTFWLMRITIILTGLVGTIRMYQNQHTFWQIIAGFINGFICVYTTIKLFAQ